MSSVVIREYREGDDLGEITSVLHAAYEQLLDLGFRYLATHQSSDVTRSRISKGTCFLAVDAERIVGTITYYSSINTGGSPHYDEAGVCSFGQFGVLPEYQGKGSGKMLYDHVEQRAIRDGAQYIALDTSEGALHLIELYRRWGFAVVEYAQWKDVNYRSVIMSKRLEQK